ncbi:putative bifunctional diguanylate cyclase/phosphodiesterase [Catenuloplanes indicus]|uniref:Diguanylate cyclase (GGDEF)-like protein n=1 Tax=Catenuloplanes indicus TaxID=137267 RepID=A0AAE3W3K7_9ACTN|nr:EAL domain-containing protein [Catenuloplanes indicus]MDQ0368726.1 diguanylate cyclase (GGDEF)-like protein [Catenuloplanes indicus]
MLATLIERAARGDTVELNLTGDRVIGRWAHIIRRRFPAAETLSDQARDDIASLASTLRLVRADTPCPVLDELFRGEPGLTSVAVEGPDGRLGLIMRERFLLVMSGAFGYGRPLTNRQTVAEITDWHPLVLLAGTSVLTAAQRLRTRPREARYDDVIVSDGDTRLSSVSAALLLDTLTERLSAKVIRDELTGLANRAHFLERLEAACIDASDPDEPGPRVVVAFIDLDHMKKINDSFGHHVGDVVLTSLAARLAAVAKEDELVARLGGDEFAVLTRLPEEAGEHEAKEIGDRYRAAAAETDPAVAPAARTKASVGVAVSGAQADAETVLSAADMAMYRAKQAGGDDVVTVLGVDAGLPGDVEQVDRSVRQAIAGDELRLVYQPIVRIQDRSVVSVEALVRWEHPRLGRLSPDRFLPGAERTGQMPALDRWVLRTACADLVTLTQRLGDAAPPSVNVNVSTRTLTTPFDETVLDVLAETGLPPDRLRLELPETADLTLLAGAHARLERLREAGVHLTLDDMGAGSTTLRHLSTLTVHGMKIDQVFVAGMLDNPRDHTVVKLLTDLGHGLQLRVTAEGVETAAQLEALAALGVEHAQGWHIGRPAPLEDLAATLTSP